MACKDRSGFKKLIPVANPIKEPARFDVECRKAGATWLLANPTAKRPKSLWTKFNKDLREGFSSRCGFQGLFLSSGTVDHFESWSKNKGRAYEWSNFRFVEGWLNSSKNGKPTENIMDPFHVGEGWFEVLLPSLQLVVSDTIPPEHRAKAESTLSTLPIRDDERAVQTRRAWMKLYEDGDITLSGLDKMFPLLAAAIRKRDGL
jgi:hypothetical protein